MYVFVDRMYFVKMYFVDRFRQQCRISQQIIKYILFIENKSMQINLKPPLCMHS